MSETPFSTPRTDATAKQIGRIIARYASEPDLSLPDAAVLLDAAMDDARQLERELAEAAKENNILRGLLPKLTNKCHYCGLENIGECKSGFPGCALADDLFAGDEEMIHHAFADRDRWQKMAEELAVCAEYNLDILRTLMIELHSERKVSIEGRYTINDTKETLARFNAMKDQLTTKTKQNP